MKIKQRKSELIRANKALEQKYEKCRGELNAAKKEISCLQDGAKQLSRIVDAVLIEVAKKFGAEIGEGIFEIKLPMVVLTGEQEMELAALCDEKDRAYILRAEKKNRKK